MTHQLFRTGDPNRDEQLSYQYETLIKQQADELRHLFQTAPTVGNLFHASLEAQLQTKAADPVYEEFQIQVQQTVERLYTQARPFLDEMERQFEWSHRFAREMTVVYQTSQPFPPIRVEVFSKYFLSPDFPIPSNLTINLTSKYSQKKDLNYKLGVHTSSCCFFVRVVDDPVQIDQMRKLQLVFSNTGKIPVCSADKDRKIILFPLSKLRVKPSALQRCASLQEYFNKPDLTFLAVMDAEGFGLPPNKNEEQFYFDPELGGWNERRNSNDSSITDSSVGTNQGYPQETSVPAMDQALLATLARIGPNPVTQSTVPATTSRDPRLARSTSNLPMNPPSRDPRLARQTIASPELKEVNFERPPSRSVLIKQQLMKQDD